MWLPQPNPHTSPTHIPYDCEFIDASPSHIPVDCKLTPNVLNSAIVNLQSQNLTLLALICNPPECEMAVHHRDDRVLVMCAGLGGGHQLVSGCMVEVVASWQWMRLPSIVHLC